MEESKAGLAAIKAELSQLTFEAATLRDLNQQQSDGLAETVGRLQRERAEEAAWNKEIGDRTDALTRKLNALQSERRWMTRKMEEAVTEQGELERSVADYKSQLEATRVLPEPVISLSRPSDQPTGGNEPSLTASGSSVPPSTMTPSTPSPPPQDLSPVRPSKPAKPEEKSWLSSVKGWLDSIWNWIVS